MAKKAAQPEVKPTYLFRLSSEHARAVQQALGLYQRLAMGDFHELSHEFEGKNADWQLQREQGLDEVLDRLKKILAPELNPRGHNYGYGTPETGRTGHLVYEALMALRYRIAWTERPPKPGEYSMDVSHGPPILFPSGVEQKPECISEDGKRPELEVSPHKLARELEEELGTTNIADALARIRELKKAAGEQTKTGPKRK